MEGELTDEQYMRNLYEKFLAEVLDNNNSEFYEKDELLDIFDFAQDEGNEMVQLYVFLTAARLYPNSDFLDERKAFFLSALNDQSARNMLKRRGRKDNPLWRILEMSLDTYPDGNPQEALAELLSHDTTPLSCEAVIRLLDTLHDLDRDDLIAENLHIMRDRAENPHVLYFEAAEILHRNENYENLARDIAEELTIQEAFNAENWVLLAKIEFTLHHIDEALQAVDYALAIDPDNRRANLVQGIALTSNQDTIDEGISRLQKCIALEPDNLTAIKALASAYIEKQKPQAAVAAYVSALENNPSESSILIEILKLQSENPLPIIEKFDSLQPSVSERQWIDIANQLLLSNLAETAEMVLSYFNKVHKLTIGMEFYLRILYRVKRYSDYVELFSTCCAEAAQPGGPAYEFSINAYLHLASCYLLTGRYKEANELCTVILNDPPHPSDIDDIMRVRGITLTLSFIRKLANDPGKISDDPDFDPLSFQVGLS